MFTSNIFRISAVIDADSEIKVEAIFGCLLAKIFRLKI